MTLPIGVAILQMDVAFQGAAPTYDYIARVMGRALADELATEAPSKVAGIRWAGTGPRVVRKVNTSGRPGGTVFAVAVLVTDDPAVFTRFSAAQLRDMIGIVAASAGSNIDRALAVGSSASGRTAQYSETMNGPLTFWTGGQAQQTRTRELFPQTSVVGGTSPDQGENPYGPNTADVTPTQPGTSPRDWTDLVRAITVAAGTLGTIWLLVSLSSAYKSARSTVSTAQRVRQIASGR
jgi:hypothetical protein